MPKLDGVQTLEAIRLIDPAAKLVQPVREGMAGKTTVAPAVAAQLATRLTTRSIPRKAQ
jgi:hypothetical protein